MQAVGAFVVAGFAARCLAPVAAVVVLGACGGSEREQPGDRGSTVYCGSYESSTPGTAVSSPPC